MFKHAVLWLAFTSVAAAFLAPSVFAHGVAEADASFLESVSGIQPFAFMYLGAKHMFTGYDHLLFLVGVIFFLYRMKDVAVYVTLFAVGHSITLLAGVLGGIHVNPFVVDAIIGMSVVYKAFDNMGGFRSFGAQPNNRIAVFLFGLVHGLGLSTKLQDFVLSEDGLIVNIISFNIGVELGQLVALIPMLIIFQLWRRSERFLHSAFIANGVIMTAGFMLVGYQLMGLI